MWPRDSLTNGEDFELAQTSVDSPSTTRRRPYGAATPKHIFSSYLAEADDPLIGDP
jgi:hypothetical protein